MRPAEIAVAIKELKNSTKIVRKKNNKLQQKQGKQKNIDRDTNRYTSRYR